MHNWASIFSWMIFIAEGPVVDDSEQLRRKWKKWTKVVDASHGVLNEATKIIAGGRRPQVAAVKSNACVTVSGGIASRYSRIALLEAL